MTDGLQDAPASVQRPLSAEVTPSHVSKHNFAVAGDEADQAALASSNDEVGDPHVQSRGIFLPRGAQLRIARGGLTIRVNDEGEFVMDPVSPQLRMDLWPQWLQESLDATVTATTAHADVLAEVATPTNDQRLGDLMDLEMRASMRAITSAAFAVDAFYAAVQARSPEHPDRATWHSRGRRRTPRQAQVYEMLRYHLKLKPPGATEIRRRIRELFRYRGWAVHADSRFGDPVLLEDVQRGVDWHYAAFRADNAVTTLGMTLQMLDVLVATFGRGSAELRESAPVARARLDEILDRYDALEGLTPFPRARDGMGGLSSALSSSTDDE